MSRLYGNPTNSGGDADIDNDDADAERWNEIVYEFTQPNETYAHVHVHYFFLIFNQFVAWRYCFSESLQRFSMRFSFLATIVWTFIILQ